MYAAGLPVLAALKSPQQYNNKRVVFSSATFNQPLSALQDAFTKVTGVQTKLHTFTYDEVASFSKEFADVCQYIKEYGYYAGEADEIDATKVTAGPFTSFQQWLTRSGIPKQFA